MLKRILHTGLAVPDLDKALEFYHTLGFETTKLFNKSDIDADVALVTRGETAFELFEFHNPAHPQVEFIRHHVAIYSDDLEADINALTDQGCKLTIPITDGVIFRFAYVQDASGTNYEIATDKN
jgi:catechol 2,3-dioxygenase-like lactoylglutathione lyase family enzyme